MISFSELWNSHPGRESSPCNFENQCAVRMGVALAALRAQELADWIAKDQTLFGKKEVYKRKDLPQMSYLNFDGKKGIVFIKDGWGATDHIDLWDGYNMKGGYSYYLSKGIEIWFWRL